MGVYRGQFATLLDGVALTFAFDYAAQDALRTLLGAQWREAVRVAMVDQDAATLAKVAAIGLRREHPELTAEAMIAWSPPVVELITAIGGALRVAWYGPAAAESEAEGKSKGIPTGAQWIRFLKTWRWLSGWASHPANSGSSVRLN